jgi:hypothetical protein
MPEDVAMGGLDVLLAAVSQTDSGRTSSSDPAHVCPQSKVHIASQIAQ